MHKLKFIVIIISLKLFFIHIFYYTIKFEKKKNCKKIVTINQLLNKQT